jgi:hypothetical protein
MRNYVVQIVFALLLLGQPAAAPVQATNDGGAGNAKQARAALDKMVQALGGAAWLNMKNQEREGHLAAFFKGKPSGGTIEFWEFHQWPDHDRYEYTKHRDVLQFYLGREGSEVTYKGKAALPKEQVDDFLRRRDHSIETVIKNWLPDPNTILVYEGQHMAERHLCEQVTLISAQNEAVTILMDIQTHLPMRRSFEWRDPLYKDKNLDAEEYDNYHVLDGLPTPLNVTRFKNEDMVRQQFIDHARYNEQLPTDFWSVDAADKRIKK